MTDIVLSTRQTLAPATHPGRPPERPFSEIMEQCNAIAGAGDLVPTCYRGKPGAVLLAKMWADSNEVDLFTALQHIYPINGRPYVSAELRVKLAGAKGYNFEVAGSNPGYCWINVTDPAGRVKSVAAAMPNETLASTPDILVHPAPEDLGKATWKHRPSDMLFALACRVADRRIANTGAAFIDAGQDYDTGPDPDPAQALADAVAASVDDVPADAEIVTDPEPDPEPVVTATAAALDDTVTGGDLLAAAKLAGVNRARLIRHAQLQLGWQGAIFDEIVSDQDVAHRLLMAIGAGEVQ